MSIDETTREAMLKISKIVQEELPGAVVTILYDEDSIENHNYLEHCVEHVLKAVEDRVQELRQNKEDALAAYNESLYSEILSIRAEVLTGRLDELHRVRDTMQALYDLQGVE